MNIYILSAISISLILLLVIIMQHNQNENKDIVNNCSLTLRVDKPSNIKLHEGLYSGFGLDIDVYYCKIEGFDEIRLVADNSKRMPNPMPDLYEFVLKPNSTANITFLINVNQEWETKDRVLKGVELLRHFNIIDEQLFYDDSKVRVYQSDMHILSDKSVLVTYTFEADKDAKGATYRIPLFVHTKFSSIYLSILRPA